MKSRSRAVMGAAITAIVAMIVASCGSTGNSSDDANQETAASQQTSQQESEPSSADGAEAPAEEEPASGESSAEEPAAEAEKPSYSLEIGQISKSVAFFPIFVARDQGFFEEEGLTVNEPTLLGTGAKLAAALVSESIEVGGGVMTDAFNTANAGQSVGVIANLVGQYYVDIIVGNDAQVAQDDAPLEEKIRSLEGLRIGITGPGSGNEALVKYLFSLVDMDSATDVTLVNLGAQATAVVGAVKNDQVDALSFFQPIGQEVEAQGLGKIYISPARGDVPDIEGQAHGVAMASAKAIADKPDVLVAYIKGIAKAEHFIHNADASEIEAVFLRYNENMDPNTVKALVTTLQAEVPETPEVTEQGYEIATHFHEMAGMIDAAPTYADLIQKSLIDQALAG